MSQHPSPHTSSYGTPFQKQHSQHSTSTTSPRLVFSWDPYSKDGDSRQQSMMAESDQEDHLMLPPPESTSLGHSGRSAGAADELTRFQLDAVPGPMVSCDTGVYKDEDDEGNPEPLPPGSAPGTTTQPPSMMNRRSEPTPATTTTNTVVAGAIPTVTFMKKPVQPHHPRPASPSAPAQSAAKAVSAPLDDDSGAETPTNSPPAAPAVVPLTLSDVLSDAASRSPYISPRLRPLVASDTATPRQDGTPTSGRLQMVAQGRPNDPRKYYLDYSPAASQNGSVSGGAGGGNSLGNSHSSAPPFMTRQYSGAGGGGGGARAAPLLDNAALANSMSSQHSSRSPSAMPGVVMRHSPYGTPRAQGVPSGSVSPHQAPFVLPSTVTAPVVPEDPHRHEMDFATVEELGRVEAEPSPFLALMMPPPPSCRALVRTVGEVRRVMDLCERWTGFVEAFLRGRRDGTGELAEPTPRVAVALDRVAPSAEVLAAALDTLPPLPTLSTLLPTPQPAPQSVWAVVADPPMGPPPGSLAGGAPSVEIEEDQRRLEAWYAEAVAWWKTLHPSTRFDISEWARSTQAAIERLSRGPRSGGPAGNHGGPMGRGGRGRQYNNNNNYGGRGGGGGGGGHYQQQQQYHYQQQQQQTYYDPFNASGGAPMNANAQWSVMGAEAGYPTRGAAGGGAGGYGWGGAAAGGGMPDTVLNPYSGGVGGGYDGTSGGGGGGRGRAMYGGPQGGNMNYMSGAGVIGSSGYGGQGMGAFHNTGNYRGGGGGTF